MPSSAKGISVDQWIPQKNICLPLGLIFSGAVLKAIIKMQQYGQRHSERAVKKRGFRSVIEQKKT